VLYRLFTLQPGIFESFFEHSLIARGVSKEIISYELINWREEFGLGGYKQVDDRPFGGGSGMVLMVDQIYKALQKYDAVSSLYEVKKDLVEHLKLYPNNSAFEQKINSQLQLNSTLMVKPKATVMLTPRGFPITQQTVEWLAGNFSELNILCGRYEGFDARVSEVVDMELSVGNFVLNGGEVGSMALVEAVSRLLPDFVTKGDTVMHDSFSSGLNFYGEQEEFVVGKRKIESLRLGNKTPRQASPATPQEGNLLNPNRGEVKLFNNTWWGENILPFIEHPQYTRPEIWQNMRVPEVLLKGDHKKIQAWRKKWY
jgi:tRNA (guanine37-N1)-methyltransferase